MRMDGSDLQQVTKPFCTRSCAINAWAWSPDGSRIAFSKDGAVTAIGVDDGSIQRLGDCPRPATHDVGGDAGACTALAWSPDGSRIAFFRAGSRSAGLYMVDADGGGERRVA